MSPTVIIKKQGPLRQIEAKLFWTGQNTIRNCEKEEENWENTNKESHCIGIFLDKNSLK